MCAHVQTNVLRVLRVLRVPVVQFCTRLWRRVFGVLRLLCVLLGLCVLCALCALYTFSKPYVQHPWPQKRASGQERTDGRVWHAYLNHMGFLFPLVGKQCGRGMCRHLKEHGIVPRLWTALNLWHAQMLRRHKLPTL